jgi:hypothetical protein
LKCIRWQKPPILLHNRPSQAGWIWSNFSVLNTSVLTHPQNRFSGVTFKKVTIPLAYLLYVPKTRPTYHWLPTNLSRTLLGHQMHTM